MRTKTLPVTMLVLTLSTVSQAADRSATWNITAITATAMAGQNAIVQSRSLAIVQVAVHDALNGIERRFEPYALNAQTDRGASPEAAMATAAHDALVGLIPVGALPFLGFGSVAQQTAAIGFVNSAYRTDLSHHPERGAKNTWNCSRSRGCPSSPRSARCGPCDRLRAIQPRHGSR